MGSAIIRGGILLAPTKERPKDISIGLYSKEDLRAFALRGGELGPWLEDGAWEKETGQ